MRIRFAEWSSYRSDCSRLDSVLDHSHHKGDEFLLLLVIADAIDKGRGVSCASIGYLVTRHGMRRRKIFRVLKWLRCWRLASGKRHRWRRPREHESLQLESAALEQCCR